MKINLQFVLSLLLAGAVTIAAVCFLRPFFEKLYNKALHYKKKVTLKDRAELFAGKLPSGYLKKEIHEIKQMMIYAGKEKQFRVVQLLSVLLFVAGVAVALLMKNPYLVPVTGGVFAAAPFLYVKSIHSLYKRKVNRELESSLSLLTSTYMGRDDFISCVKDNLPYMSGSIVPFFEEFLVDNKVIDASIISSLNKLKLKINNGIFHAWVDCVKQSQRDATVKNNLTMIIKQFSENRTTQQEVDALMDSAKRGALSMAAMVTAFPFLVKLFSADWFKAYSTTFGKLSIAVSVVFVAISLWRVFVLSQPIETKEAS